MKLANWFLLARKATVIGILVFLNDIDFNWASSLLQAHDADELQRWGLVRVSEHFRVIALGLPVPRYRGSPLDPPLRSRFQARDVSHISYQVSREYIISISLEGVGFSFLQHINTHNYFIQNISLLTNLFSLLYMWFIITIRLYKQFCINSNNLNKTTNNLPFNFINTIDMSMLECKNETRFFCITNRPFTWGGLETKSLSRFCSQTEGNRKTKRPTNDRCCWVHSTFQCAPSACKCSYILCIYYTWTDDMYTEHNAQDAYHEISQRQSVVDLFFAGRHM